MATLPARQGRNAWRYELRALLAEARRRGDLRPATELINEWLRFRQQHTDPTPAEDRCLPCWMHACRQCDRGDCRCECRTAGR